MGENRLFTELVQMRRFIDIMGMKSINHNDKKIINYVIKRLDSFNTGTVVSCGSVSIVKAFQDSFEGLRIFGDDVYQKAYTTLSNIPLESILPKSDSYSSYVEYQADDNTLLVDKNSGAVLHYKVPVNPDNTSFIYLGHEHIHALKETNFDEYINGFVVGDVIPIFYELVSAENAGDLKKMLLQSRMNILLQSKLEYKYFFDLSRMKEHKKYKSLYEVILTRTGNYLNSFYYALILFNIYKVNPDLIIMKINEVLNHKITTIEMLEYLGLLYKDNNMIFDQELDNIKRVLK